MQHDIDMAELALREARVEVAAIEVVAELRAEQVAVLGPIGQVVDGDHVVDADGVQAMHEVAADHPGRTGHDDLHSNNSS